MLNLLRQSQLQSIRDIPDTVSTEQRSCFLNKSIGETRDNADCSVQCPSAASSCGISDKNFCNLYCGHVDIDTKGGVINQVNSYKNLLNDCIKIQELEPKKCTESDLKICQKRCGNPPDSLCIDVIGGYGNNYCSGTSSYKHPSDNGSVNISSNTSDNTPPSDTPSDDTPDETEQESCDIRITNFFSTLNTKGFTAKKCSADCESNVVDCSIDSSEIVTKCDKACKDFEKTIKKDEHRKSRKNPWYKENAVILTLSALLVIFIIIAVFLVLRNRQ